MKDFRLEDDTCYLVECKPKKRGKEEEKHDEVAIKFTRQGDDELLNCLVADVKGFNGLLWDKQGHRLSHITQLKCALTRTNMQVRVTRLHHDPIVLSWAKVHKFVIDIDETDMGMCNVSFVVEAQPHSPEDVGLLCHWSQELVEVTILTEDEARADDGQGDLTQDVRRSLTRKGRGDLANDVGKVARVE